MSKTGLILGAILMVASCTIGKQKAPSIKADPAPPTKESKVIHCFQDSGLIFLLYVYLDPKKYMSVEYKRGCRCFFKIEDKIFVHVDSISKDKCNEYQSSIK